jgi:hypothetical protein
MTAADKVYDGGSVASITGSLVLVSGGVVSGDVVVLDVSGAPVGAFDTKNVGSGKSVSVSGVSVALSGGDAENYTVSGPPGLAADITPKALSVTGLTAVDKVYDGGTVASITGTPVLGSGVVSGDVVVLDPAGIPVGGFDSRNVGVDKPVTVSGLQLSGGDAVNYTVSGPSGLMANITPKALSVTGLSAEDKTYDGSTVASLTGTPVLVSGGVVSGDVVVLDPAGIPVGGFDSRNVGVDKPVTVSGLQLSGGDAGNYTVSGPSGLVADVTVRSVVFGGVVRAEREVGDTDPTSFSLHVVGEDSFTGVVAGESLVLGVSGVSEVVPPNYSVEGSFDGVVVGAFGLLADGVGTHVGNYVLSAEPVVRVTVAPVDIVLGVTVSAPGQTVTLSQYFTNAYTVSWGDGSADQTSGSLTHTYSAAGSYEVRLKSGESGAQLWRFRSGGGEGLVPSHGTTAGVVVKAMPQMARFMNGQDPGNAFFDSFNYDGTLTGLPEGSFDTSGITGTVGSDFFWSFNTSGALVSLPDGSFDIGGITSVGQSFFQGFNYDGALVSLPDGSFDTGGITSVGGTFLSAFNASGDLVSLPDGSFDTSGIESVDNSFFAGFNYSGNLVSLPDGSFDISGISGSVGTAFFAGFNESGALVGLPDGSFDTGGISGSVGNSFFQSFNQSGQLVSLPDGSFDTSGITSVGNYFFQNFNQSGQLVGLPDGSFDTSGIESVGNYFFQSFNQSGHLVALPGGSFNTSGISGSVGSSFFRSFNSSGDLVGLPDGSFDTSGITSVGYAFFAFFNSYGALEYVPDSFKWPALDATNASIATIFNEAFRSPSVKINRDALLIINGCATPAYSAYTFSSNQPGYDSLDANWQVP